MQGVDGSKVAGGTLDRKTRFARPTQPPPKLPGLGSVLARNIRTLQERRKRDEVGATLEQRVAGAITRFTGSMRFVYLHVAIFGVDHRQPRLGSWRR